MTGTSPRRSLRRSYGIFLQRAFRRTPVWLRIRIIRVLKPAHTIGALAFVESGERVLMLRQRHRNGWTLPGGLLDRGETAAETVRRELLEETGLAIEVDLPFAVVVEPRSQRVDVLFRVVVPEPFAVTVGSEALEARWLRPDEIGVVDGPTRDCMAARARLDQPDAHVGRVSRP